VPIEEEEEEDLQLFYKWKGAHSFMPYTSFNSVQEIEVRAVKADIKIHN
jgi:hypothetical protein